MRCTSAVASGEYGSPQYVMSFPVFLALRYLKPKRSALSIITLISVAGVALGVAVLIIVIGVMSGFDRRIREKFLSLDAPITLIDRSRDGAGVSLTGDERDDQNPLWRELMAQMRQVPGITGAAPMINATVLMQQSKPKEHDDLSVPPPPPEGGLTTPDTVPPEGAPEEIRPALPPANEAEAGSSGVDRRRPIQTSYLLGIDAQDATSIERYQSRFSKLHEKGMAYGKFDITGDKVVLSEDIASRLQGSNTEPLEEGRTPANLFGMKFVNEMIGYLDDKKADEKRAPEARKAEQKDRDVPAPEELTISGVFNDDEYPGMGFISLITAQRLQGTGKNVECLKLEMTDPYAASAMKKTLEPMMPEGWYVQTWMEKNKRMLDQVTNERGMMYIILAFISIVAAFCIMNTMITVAVQKRREIGMVRALGARTSQIVTLFVTKGLIIATFGVCSGVAIGLTVLHYRNELRAFIAKTFDRDIFPADIYQLASIPAELRTFDMLLICGLAFILCALAAVPAALTVGRMDPARALRNDR